MELSQSLKDAGVSATVAKQEAPSVAGEKNISVYLVAERELNATLLAKAFNKADMEIGRCVTAVNFDVDDARYVRFTFPGEMDQQTVSTYRIDRKPSGNDPGSESLNEAKSAENAVER